MICLFQLLPDLRLLQKYGYMTATEEQLIEAIANGWGEDFESEFIVGYDTQADFEQAYQQLTEQFKLTLHNDTLLYIALRENEAARLKEDNAYRIHESQLLAKELAHILVCLNDTPQSQLASLKLNTLMGSSKVTRPNLIAWIGKMVEQGLSKTKFTYNELGEGVYHLLDRDSEGIKFGAPLNYQLLRQYANKRIRGPQTHHNKLLAQFLYKVWQFLESETHVKAEAGRSYSDEQMNFLFDLAAVFSWLDELNISSDKKDYMYALFATHIRS